ncbi:hypothetical protein BDQ17DRAFT_1329778 [Cyathus striatus]|nr:hypothetical protein BDQ17DRAFT_1329778 [Cyathus striatus]
MPFALGPMLDINPVVRAQFNMTGYVQIVHDLVHAARNHQQESVDADGVISLAFYASLMKSTVLICHKLLFRDRFVPKIDWGDVYEMLGAIYVNAPFAGERGFVKDCLTAVPHLLSKSQQAHWAININNIALISGIHHVQNMMRRLRSVPNDVVIGSTLPPTPGERVGLARFTEGFNSALFALPVAGGVTSTAQGQLSVGVQAPDTVDEENDSSSDVPGLMSVAVKQKHLLYVAVIKFIGAEYLV